ncbi:hypothetical protein ACMFMG_001152 [Clarireedia jacksonii]
MQRTSSSNRIHRIRSLSVAFWTKRITGLSKVSAFCNSGFAESDVCHVTTEDVQPGFDAVPVLFPVPGSISAISAISARYEHRTANSQRLTTMQHRNPGLGGNLDYSRAAWSIRRPTEQRRWMFPGLPGGRARKGEEMRGNARNTGEFYGTRSSENTCVRVRVTINH